VERDERGRYQRMTCAACGTSQKVYTGEEGKDFQSNVDAPESVEEK
jgi:hypothetical protein